MTFRANFRREFFGTFPPKQRCDVVRAVNPDEHCPEVATLVITCRDKPTFVCDRCMPSAVLRLLARPDTILTIERLSRR